MLLKTVAGALCAAALVACAATAPAEKRVATAQPAAAEPTDAKPAVRIAKPDDLICRNEEVTGTRLTRRVCMTRAQREERSRNDRQTLENIQHQGSGSRELPSGG